MFKIPVYGKKTKQFFKQCIALIGSNIYFKNFF